MFDNLREDAASASYFEEETKYKPAANTKAAAIPAKPSRRILGMTGMQRFVITFMLFMTVCVLGAMALLITNKIAF